MQIPPLNLTPPPRYDACVRMQIIYIAPLKALVRERVNDWGNGMCAQLGKSLVELTGARALARVIECLRALA